MSLLPSCGPNTCTPASTRAHLHPHLHTRILPLWCPARAQQLPQFFLQPFPRCPLLSTGAWCWTWRLAPDLPPGGPTVPRSSLIWAWETDICRSCSSIHDNLGNRAKSCQALPHLMSAFHTIIHFKMIFKETNPVFEKLANGSDLFYFILFYFNLYSGSY